RASGVGPVASTSSWPPCSAADRFDGRLDGRLDGRSLQWRFGAGGGQARIAVAMGDAMSVEQNRWQHAEHAASQASVEVAARGARIDIRPEFGSKRGGRQRRMEFGPC